MSKEERYVPFSNGTDFMIWEGNNCSMCSKGVSGEDYNEVVKNGGVNPKCDLETTIAEATMTGDISVEHAIRIGFLPKEKLHHGKCKEFVEAIDVDDCNKT